MASTEQILRSEIETGKSPSVQYFFFDQDKVIDSFQMGYSDIAKQEKVHGKTTYNAFSVTKTFTALAILQLAEQRKLDIEQPIIQYLPDFPYGEKITVKNVLNHTAGIPNPIPLSWIHLESEHKTFDRNAFFQAILKKNNQVKSLPNAKFAYSNLGYVILGQLIEKASGMPYEEYIAENILQKLSVGPENLSFTIQSKETHAKGYHKKMSFSNLVLGLFINKSKFMGKTEGKWQPFQYFYVNGSSYGGLIGTPGAFVKYIQELLKDDSNLISDKYKHILFQENKTNANKSTGMCLSWFSGMLNNEKYFAHAGGGGGYYCEIRIYPKIKRGSVIFFNRTGMTDERYLDKLDRFYITTLR